MSPVELPFIDRYVDGVNHDLLHWARGRSNTASPPGSARYALTLKP